MNHDETTHSGDCSNKLSIVSTLNVQPPNQPPTVNGGAFNRSDSTRNKSTSNQSKRIPRWMDPRRIDPLSFLPKGWVVVPDGERGVKSDAASEAMSLFKKSGLTRALITEYQEKRKNAFQETIIEGFVHVANSQSSRFNYLDLHVLYFLVTGQVYQHGQTAPGQSQVWEQKITPQAALEQMMRQDAAWWEGKVKQCQPTVRTASASDAQQATRVQRTYAQVLKEGQLKTARALSTHIDVNDLEEDGWEIVSRGCSG